MSASLWLDPVNLAVRDWDVHVDRCDLCLARGNDLCYEGQFLADEVSITRARSMEPDRPRSPLRAPRRRAMFAGVRA